MKFLLEDRLGREESKRFGNQAGGGRPGRNRGQNLWEAERCDCIPGTR
jgi:hypothetical protein